MTELYIGLMSGTSIDGIDAALVDFSQDSASIIATHYVPYSKNLRKNIIALCQTNDNEIQRLGELDVMLGKEFANAVNHLLKQQSLSPKVIQAIGSHGQTIRHDPHHHFTLQIGDPNIIAAQTGITTVADFRRKDIALGGQGAPLVPAFHQYLFASDHLCRAIVNIGGIANITLLPKKQAHPIIGFDTGPGNALMDTWIYTHKKELYDKDGAWGKEGQIQQKFLTLLLSDDYFQRSPPKSTGLEYFNLSWLMKQIRTFKKKLTLVDVQATLTELTAHTIMTAVRSYFSDGEILICGGGVHNHFLMTRLRALAQPHYTVDSVQKYGINPDWVEAMAFAWLARQTLRHQPGNLPSVTGATQASVLGAIYW